MPTKRAGAKKPVHLAPRATRRAPRRNQSFTAAAGTKLMNGFGGTVAFGLGSYAAPRLAARLARRLVARKRPDLAKHAAVFAALLVVVGVWFSPKFWARARKHDMALKLGSTIAMVQTLVQTYLPGLAWIFDSDPLMLPAPPAATVTAAQAQGNAAYARERARRSRMRYVSPGELESARAAANLNDGSFNVPGAPQVTTNDEESPEEAVSGANEDMSSILGEDESMKDLYDGVFSAN